MFVKRTYHFVVLKFTVALLSIPLSTDDLNA